jgi:hypothetical protein
MKECEVGGGIDTKKQNMAVFKLLLTYPFIKDRIEKRAKNRKI